MTSFTPHTFQVDTFTVEDASIFTYRLSPHKPRKDNLTAVILHGGGQATNSTSYDAFAQLFANNGVAVISIDFVGHGKTGGSMTDNSLVLRERHALAAIQHWVAPEAPLVLIGFSMSGHTVMCLTATLGKRVQHLGLFCPATYAIEAENINFGSDFSKILRTPDSWRASQGLANLANFTGRTLLVTGAHDDVVDWEITSEMITRAKANSREVRVEIIGSRDHHLVRWMSEHPAFSEQLVRYFVEDEL